MGCEVEALSATEAKGTNDYCCGGILLVAAQSVTGSYRYKYLHRYKYKDACHPFSPFQCIGPDHGHQSYNLDDDASHHTKRPVDTAAAVTTASVSVSRRLLSRRGLATPPFLLLLSLLRRPESSQSGLC